MGQGCDRASTRPAGLADSGGRPTPVNEHLGSAVRAEDALASLCDPEGLHLLDRVVEAG
jgi:hypothetical protein